MNIIFFGSDDFAATNLEELIQSQHKVIGCVTQPDTRQGRGLKVAISPIKILSETHNIDCIQPEKLKDPSVVAWLKDKKADLFVVVAYGRLLSQEILDIPKLFCVNVHGSLLPQYRGAAPINWAILNGDNVTGVTVQKMALALDAGDIIAQEKMDLSNDMTADVLRPSMASVGAKLLVKTLDTIALGKHSFTPQDNSNVTYAPKLTKEMGEIVWKDAAQVIYNQIRGLKPWPGTYTFYQGKMLKIINATACNGKGKPGEVIAVDKKGICVACGHDALLITDVHPEAGKIMSASSFTAGYKLISGSVLGN
jgi:methionyl-tRNA formyltransferase